MLQSAYRKEWYVGACIARGFLGTPIGSKIPTITEYSETFSCSRGVVQNALANLEKQKAILLDRSGKKGTFLVDREEEKLFHYAGLSHLTASMPPPIDRYFAGIATGICQEMSQCPVPFTFAFVQGSKSRVQSLLSGAYDFVVTTKFSADFYISKYPEIEIAFPFDHCLYAPPHRLYLSNPEKNGVEDGMTLAVDPSSYDQVTLTRRICRGKQVNIREMPFVSALYALFSGQIDGLVFRDGLQRRDHELYRVVLPQDMPMPMHEVHVVDIPESDPDMECPVALIHRDNCGIRGILENYLTGDCVGSIQKKVKDGTMLPRFY